VTGLDCRSTENGHIIGARVDFTVWTRNCCRLYWWPKCGWLREWWYSAHGGHIRSTNQPHNY